jgi:hypothetical protein
VTIFRKLSGKYGKPERSEKDEEGRQNTKGEV